METTAPSLDATTTATSTAGSVTLLAMAKLRKDPPTQYATDRRKDVYEPSTMSRTLSFALSQPSAGSKSSRIYSTPNRSSERGIYYPTPGTPQYTRTVLASPPRLLTRIQQHPEQCNDQSPSDDRIFTKADPQTNEYRTSHAQTADTLLGTAKCLGRNGENEVSYVLP